MIRLGVIGCGGRAGRLVSEIAELDSAVELVGVLDPDVDGVRSRLPERFAGAPFYDSVGALNRGARPTALLVGTRCHLHTEYAIEVVDLDLPLFLEKPVSISMEQAQRLEAAYAGRYERVVVSFPLRVSSLTELIAGRIRSGALGSPEHISATNYVSYGTVYWEQGYRNFTITGGLFLQKATHDFDYIAMLMGSPIVQVAAMGNYGRVFGGDKPPGLRCSACDETATCPESPENRRRNGLRTADDHLCLFSSDTRTTRAPTRTAPPRCCGSPPARTAPTPRCSSRAATRTGAAPWSPATRGRSSSTSTVRTTGRCAITTASARRATLTKAKADITAATPICSATSSRWPATARPRAPTCAAA